MNDIYKCQLTKVNFLMKINQMIIVLLVKYCIQTKESVVLLMIFVGIVIKNKLIKLIVIKKAESDS